MVTSVTVGIVFGILTSITAFVLFVLYDYLPFYREWYYDDEMKLPFFTELIILLFKPLPQS